MSNFIVLVAFISSCLFLVHLDAKSKREYYICTNNVNKTISYPMRKYEYETLISVNSDNYLRHHTCERKVLTKETAAYLKRIVK